MNGDGAETWYYVIGPDRRRYGPLTLETLQEWRRDRRIGSASPVCLAGDEAWRTLRDFPEVYAAPAPLPPPVPSAQLPPTLPTQSFRAAELEIPNHAIAAVVLTLVGCLPLGMAAIYYSQRVGPLARKGDIEGAWRASRRARVWCWIAFLLGFPAWVLGTVAMFKWLGFS